MRLNAELVFYTDNTGVLLGRRLSKINTFSNSCGLNDVLFTNITETRVIEL